MAYKDKDKQREAQRQWVRQKRANQGSTGEGSTTDTNYVNSLAFDDIKRMSAGEAKGLLDLWAEDGTEYQKRLALLGQAYTYRTEDKRGWLGCARHKGKNA